MKPLVDFTCANTIIYMQKLFNPFPIDTSAKEDLVKQCEKGDILFATINILSLSDFPYISQSQVLKNVCM